MGHGWEDAGVAGTAAVAVAGTLAEAVGDTSATEVTGNTAEAIDGTAAEVVAGPTAKAVAGTAATAMIGTAAVALSRCSSCSLRRWRWRQYLFYGTNAVTAAADQGAALERGSGAPPEALPPWRSGKAPDGIESPGSTRHAHY